MRGGGEGGGGWVGPGNIRPQAAPGSQAVCSVTDRNSHNGPRP